MLQRVLLPNGQTDGHGLWLMGCQEVSSHWERTLPLRNLVTDASAIENHEVRFKQTMQNTSSPGKKACILTYTNCTCYFRSLTVHAILDHEQTSTSYISKRGSSSDPAFPMNSALEAGWSELPSYSSCCGNMIAWKHISVPLLYLQYGNPCMVI